MYTYECARDENNVHCPRSHVTYRPPPIDVSNEDEQIKDDGDGACYNDRNIFRQNPRILRAIQRGRDVCDVEIRGESSGANGPSDMGI